MQLQKSELATYKIVREIWLGNKEFHFFSTEQKVRTNSDKITQTGVVSYHRTTSCAIKLQNYWLTWFQKVTVAEAGKNWNLWIMSTKNARFYCGWSHPTKQKPRFSAL